MTLTKKIEDWLQKGGFPFEMKVASCFAKNGFKIGQSIYYRDKETGKYRETDIIAYKYKKINGRWIVLSFVIECKSIKDKPWVVFSNQKVENSLVKNLPVYASNNIVDLFDNLSGAKFSSDLFFKNDRVFGYSMTTAFNNNTDKSFEAIQSVNKACEYLIDQQNDRSTRTAFIYFPCIFVEGTLFSASMNDSDVISVEEINKAELLIGRSFHTHGHSRVFVFNDTKLDKTVKELKKSVDLFLTKNKYHIEKHFKQ